MKPKFILIWLLIVIFFFSVNLLDSQKILAQSSTEFRGEISSLRTRINSLENEVRRLSQTNFQNNRPGTPSSLNSTNQNNLSTINNPPNVDGQSIGRSDPMFERLATLLIELKEDMRSLDQRLTKVEQEVNN